MRDVQVAGRGTLGFVPKRRAVNVQARCRDNGWHAQLSAEALGLGVVVFVAVTLATHSPDTSKRFRRLIDGLEEVQEAYALTGTADYLVKLVVPDLKALATILNDVFLPHASIQHVHSSIVLDRLKQTSKLPLGHIPR